MIKAKYTQGDNSQEFEFNSIEEVIAYERSNGNNGSLSILDMEKKTDWRGFLSGEGVVDLSGMTHRQALDESKKLNEEVMKEFNKPVYCDEQGKPYEDAMINYTAEAEIRASQEYNAKVDISVQVKDLKKKARIIRREINGPTKQRVPNELTRYLINQITKLKL